VKLTPYNSSKIVEFRDDFFAGFDAAHYGINVNHAKSKLHVVFWPSTTQSIQAAWTAVLYASYWFLISIMDKLLLPENAKLSPPDERGIFFSACSTYC
jgi:hypothetical protein